MFLLLQAHCLSLLLLFQRYRAASDGHVSGYRCLDGNCSTHGTYIMEDRTIYRYCAPCHKQISFDRAVNKHGSSSDVCVALNCPRYRHGITSREIIGFHDFIFLGERYFLVFYWLLHRQGRREEGVSRVMENSVANNFMGIIPFYSSIRKMGKEEKRMPPLRQIRFECYRI